MAETDAETLPNGTGAISTEEEDERMKQRPADIDADVREMERRKRVEALMSSKLFREELERVLDQQMHEGNDAPLLQRIREMVGGRLHTGSLRGPACVLPINDIRGIEGVGYEKGEKILRCKLAAVYRLVDLFGWTQTGITGQITARLNTAVESVLTTPRGLLPHEVTASSLVKVDMQGAVQDQGTTNFPVNVEGFSLHASVHAARPDVRCVLHVRSGGALAVSAMRRGLLPLCSEAALLGDIAYHRVPNGILDNEERDKLVRALGPSAKVLMLSSGGALCCGATLEEAFFQARNLTAACDIQLRLAAVPVDELALIDEETRRQMYEQSRTAPAEGAKWRVGGEEFEALMRMLDNAGFRTGYIYRHPLVKNDVPRPKNDVEVPPAVSSLGYLLEEEELYKQGLWKKGQGKTGERTRWLNSPNVYQKVEVLETGTADPKKITKWVDANNEEWVQDGSPAHSSTPVKIDTLQFVPKNTNPKEFKKLQQQIKENRRADKISAGPQSHILEGVTWDEASKLIGEDAANTHTGDHVVLMGAASKGIIQRGYQHNAAVYSAPYARNPFDHVTDNEIDEYRRTVERKQRPGDYDTDLSESEAISAAQVTSPASAPSETEEESRDEHRVLRIETKQAPVRSQPEVVLSDVDTSDFLNAERAHADRTKVIHQQVATRDPNLLSDDEVFFDSPASPLTSSGMTSPNIQHVVVRDMPRDLRQMSNDEAVFYSARPAGPVQGPVVVRSHHAAVQQTVARGKNEEREALTTNKRSKYDYSRVTNFDNIVKNFDSPLKVPKCKVSLTNRLGHQELWHASSRSSLYSIPSIEWDGRCKSDFGIRTRSLSRQRSSHGKLFRTLSHSGFINSYIKDPEPTHYHIPRCSSCGAASISYAWELSKEEKVKNRNLKNQSAVYYSVDNIPQKCLEENDRGATHVKVLEKFIPVLKIEKKENEFVESQEFNEDNYIGDIGNSFSSENQTVIEKDEGGDEATPTITKDDKTAFIEDVLPLDTVDDVNRTIESIEGEYHSFTDLEDSYESPVKELVEKDIRDYSVPIDFYCDDYKTKDDKRSPLKVKNILEPILEESKSSYGDECNTSQLDKKELIENVSNDILGSEPVVSEYDNKISNTSSGRFTVVSVEQDNYMTNDAAEVNVPINKNEINNNIDEGIMPLIENKHTTPKRSTSFGSTLSSNDRTSFDSTAEFEKYEVVAEVIAIIINRIEFTVPFVELNPHIKLEEPAETFSIAKIIEDIEQNVCPNDTVLTEISVIDISSQSNIVVESVMYYIFDRAMFVSHERSKINKNRDKKVVTVVDWEDILYTAKPIWFDADDRPKIDIKRSVNVSGDKEVDEHMKQNNLNNKQLDSEVKQQIKDQDLVIENLSSHEMSEAVLSFIENYFDEVVHDRQSEGILTDNIASCHEDNTSFNGEVSEYTEAVEIHDPNLTINSEIHCEDFENIHKTKISIRKDISFEEDIKHKSMYFVEENNTDNFHAITNNVDDMYVQNSTEMNYINATHNTDIDKIHNETFIDSSEMNNAFFEETSCTEEHLISSSPDIQSKHTTLYPSIKNEINNDSNENYLPNLLNNLDNESQISYDEFRGEADLEKSRLLAQEKEYMCYENPALSLSKEAIFYDDNHDLSAFESSNRISSDIYFTPPSFSETPQKYSSTKALSRSSSPNRTPIFELADSPIKTPLSTRDTTVDAISPFVKKPNVISIKQTENSGGVKFWVSFDEQLVENEKKSVRSIKSIDDTLPSFISIDFNDDNESKKNEFIEKVNTKRSSILLNDYTKGENLAASGSCMEYASCQSLMESNIHKECELGTMQEEPDPPQKKLIYEVYSKPSKRQYSSWPPYEDTLFYKIISQFRMSESFDPSDLDATRFDNSL